MKCYVCKAINAVQEYNKHHSLTSYQNARHAIRNLSWGPANCELHRSQEGFLAATDLLGKLIDNKPESTGVKANG